MRSKDIWLKFGCFLTGHNYELMLNSSEASVKFVKKNLAAFLIISILWGFIGYSFAKRYVHLNNLGAGIVSLVMVVIIIQVERQITMTVNRNWLAIIFRMVIGVVMAIIGSIIIDQIIFKDDVEKKSIALDQEEVNMAMPDASKETDSQIDTLRSWILRVEAEKANIIKDVTANPNIKSVDVSSITTRSDSGIESSTTQKTIREVPNPKRDLIPAKEEQIKKLTSQYIEKQNYKINLQNELQKEIKAKRGFLNELTALRKVLSEDTSGIAFFVWCLLFVFFLSLELFVLINKLTDKGLDYDKLVAHQVATKMAVLEKLKAK
jgi:hypothetical protein